VPTGNFGNVLAGWIARRMGAPIADFIVASNANDILTRFINGGDMSMHAVVPTLSPSMDIQVSSNFERLLFEINGRDGGMTAEQLARLRATGSLTIEGDQREQFVDGTFRAERCDDSATLREIDRVYRSSGILVDPHTATATYAADRLGGADPDTPVVTLATAHPAKFPDAVERATGIRPELPPHLAGLLQLSERTRTLPNDLATVERFVRSVSNAS
jgi:threonine synthase